MEHHSLIEDIQYVLHEKLNVDQMLADMDVEKIVKLRIQYAGGQTSETEEYATSSVKEILDSLPRLLDRVPKALKKEDRLLVIIKTAKVVALYRALDWVTTAQLKTEVSSEFQFLKKINSRNPSFYDHIGPTISMFNVLSAVEEIGKMLQPEDGSSPIPSIAQYTWDPNKNLYEIYYELKALEQEYHNQNKGWMTVRNEELIWRSPDKKSGWFDTKVGACEREGESMGHCGNTPSRNVDSETLYSFSSVRRMGGETQRYPHITLILSDEGITGEIKGRGNTKPDSKYGNVLKEFMLLDIVNGMGPATWDVYDNWGWDDFTESQQRDIMNAKPDFDTEATGGGIFNKILAGEASDEETLDALNNIYIHNNTVVSVDGGEVKLETDYDIMEALIDTLQDDLENDLENYLIDGVDGTGDTDFAPFLSALVHPLFTTGVDFEEAHEGISAYIEEHSNWQDSAAIYLKK